MLKKEFNDVLRQTLFLVLLTVLFITVLKLVVLFIGMEHKSEDYAPIFYQLFALFFSFFHGISLFSTEQRNNGFEYLLTLPYSRSKLLLLKIAPRLTVVLGLYLIYVLISTFSSISPFLISPLSSLSLYIAFFFISTSLSVLRGNFVVNSLITFFLFFLYILVVNLVAWLVVIKHYGRFETFKSQTAAVFDPFPFTTFSIVLLIILISSPFLLSLFYGFNKYDIRTSGKYLRRFFASLIPSLIIAMVLSFVILNHNISDLYEYYYLTKGGKVIRNTLQGASVVSDGVKKKINNIYPNWHATYERGNSIYISHYDRRKRGGGKISVLNMDSLQIRDLYLPGKNRFLNSNVYGYRDIICFLEKTGTRGRGRIGKSEIIFMDLKTGELKRVAYPFPQFDLCGVVQVDDVRSWIGFFRSSGKTTVFLLKETGQAKQLTRSDWYPVYFNDMLITFEKENIVFGKISGSGYQELKRLPIHNYSFYPNRLYWTDLNPVRMNYIYGKKRDKNVIDSFVMIDLLNPEVKEFKVDNMKYGRIHFNLYGDSLFIKYEDEGHTVLDAIYRFEKNRLLLLKDFPGIKYSEWNDFYNTKNGFVVKKKKDIKFFLYPDLKELKY